MQKSMRMIKAKVLATGEEVFLSENESKPGVFFGRDAGSREFTADELEILGGSAAEADISAMPMPPKYEPLDTTAMMKEMLDSVRSHFWRDQRVEITKILLRCESVDMSDVVEKADNIVQKLKSYGE